MVLVTITDRSVVPYGTVLRSEYLTLPYLTYDTGLVLCCLLVLIYQGAPGFAGAV